MQNERTASKTETAHTNVITLNGNRLDNNRSIVKQIIVVLLDNKTHWGHKAQGEKREYNKLHAKNRKSLFIHYTNDDRTCAKTLCTNLFTTTRKMGFLCHSSSAELLLPKCLQNCLKIETFAVVHAHESHEFHTVLDICQQLNGHFRWNLEILVLSVHKSNKTTNIERFVFHIKISASSMHRS